MKKINFDIGDVNALKSHLEDSFNESARRINTLVEIHNTTRMTPSDTLESEKEIRDEKSKLYDISSKFHSLPKTKFAPFPAPDHIRQQNNK